MNTGCLKKHFLARSTGASLLAAGLALAFPMAARFGQAQEPAAKNPPQMSTPDGYSGHYTVDFGGRYATTNGSGAMYNTMVNLGSGPRAQGETFELHRLASNKKGWVDNARGTSTGFGGDPYNFARFSLNKAKIYEFNGIFRRNRQYFDYDLLGNPNLPNGITVPIGSSSAPTGYLSWPQPQHSSVMTNSVRRMLDTDVTFFPLEKVTLRVAYSSNVMQGTSLLPARSAGILKYSALLQQIQRHSTDEYTVALDWKPLDATKLTFEQRWFHAKENSYFTLDPNGFFVQEADGTKAYLGNWDMVSNGSTSTTTAFAPYSAAACNTTSMASSTTFLYPAQGGLPIVDPACAVVTSYMRSNPLRTPMPTETLRFQSASIKNLSLNGQISYSWAKLNMPNYYENAWGLNGTARQESFTASGSAKREVVNANLGLAYELTKTVELEDQVTLMTNAQPASLNVAPYAKLATPSTAGSATINYAGTLTATTTSGSSLVAGMSSGYAYGYFGNEQMINDATVRWAATPRLNLALTYRYGDRQIGVMSTPMGVSTRQSFDISTNGGIFNAAYRATSNWQINGTAEVTYSDGAFTAMSPRQQDHYRIHTKFRPAKWATFTAAYADMERHNNTNNTGAASLYGQLKHVDYSRTVSVTGMITPNDRLAFDFDYAYNDVYTATNICYAAQDSGMLAGTTSPYFAAAASVDSTGAPLTCQTSSTSTTPSQWWARSFTDAPTQYGSAGIVFTPRDKLKWGAGYHANGVRGSQFFTDARAVNGSLHSTYQTPYANVNWTLHPGLVWKAEYNYFAYSEDSDPSGSQYCTLNSVATAAASNIVSCASMPVSTGMNSSPAGLTAPRAFHSTNLTLGIHYEF